MRCSHPRLVWKSTYGELLRAPGSASNGLVLPGTLRWAEKGRAGCFTNHWATCRETGNHKKKQNNREIDAEGDAAEWCRMGSLALPGALLKLLVKNTFCGSCYQSQTLDFRPSSVAETSTQRGFQHHQGEGGLTSFHWAGHCQHQRLWWASASNTETTDKSWTGGLFLWFVNPGASKKGHRVGF